MFNFLKRKKVPNLEFLKTVSVKEGDVVILRTDTFLSQEVFNALSNQLKMIFPKNIVFILDGGMELDLFPKEEQNAGQSGNSKT
jgi:hypothetical protein